MAIKNKILPILIFLLIGGIGFFIFKHPHVMDSLEIFPTDMRSSGRGGFISLIAAFIIVSLIFIFLKLIWNIVGGLFFILLGIIGIACVLFISVETQTTEIKTKQQIQTKNIETNKKQLSDLIFPVALDLGKAYLRKRANNQQQKDTI